MSNNVSQLLKKASELESAAYKEYVTNYTTTGIVALVQGGVPFEKAASMIEDTCGTNPVIGGLKTNILAFEKAAEYIVELETKVGDLEKAAAASVQTTPAVPAKVKANDPLNKLASIGFSEEEISMISQLPENLMNKVASVGSQPWDMGEAVGMAHEKTDPLLEFLLSPGRV